MPRRTLLAGALACVAALFLGPAAHAATPPAPFKGIDVSHWDSNVDWSSGDLAFGIAKATEGTDFTDSSFGRTWDRLRSQGLVRGAYHFGHPGNDPTKEADHFLDVVRAAGLQPGDLFILDLEVTDGRSTSHVNSWARKWLSYVTQQTGTKPFFYSSYSFARQYGAGLGDYPLWVAHYSRPPGQVTAPAPWTQWAIHQYSSTDHDHNVSGLTPAELRALGYQAAYQAYEGN